VATIRRMCRIYKVELEPVPAAGNPLVKSKVAPNPELTAEIKLIISTDTDINTEFDIEIEPNNTRHLKVWKYYFALLNYMEFFACNLLNAYNVTHGSTQSKITKTIQLIGQLYNILPAKDDNIYAQQDMNVYSKQARDCVVGIFTSYVSEKLYLLYCNLGGIIMNLEYKRQIHKNYNPDEEGPDSKDNIINLPLETPNKEHTPDQFFSKWDELARIDHISLNEDSCEENIINCMDLYSSLKYVVTILHEKQLRSPAIIDQTEIDTMDMATLDTLCIIGCNYTLLCIDLPNRELLDIKSLLKKHTKIDLALIYNCNHTDEDYHDYSINLVTRNK
jgi:hypothetical protein